MSPDHLPDVTAALLDMMGDASVFVKNWAITSLCIVAKEWPEHTEPIVQAIGRLAQDRSVAIRTWMHKALVCLTDPAAELPAGWVKRGAGQKPPR